MLVSEITNKLTVQDAVNSGAHFSSLRKWDEKFVVFSVATMLSELLGYVPNNLTEDQVVSIAESIVLDCENWKPDDILIIMRNGKQGKYGKIYGNFSYQTFNEWADAYAKERGEYLFQKQMKYKESPAPDTERNSLNIDKDFQQAKMQHLIDKAK